jgi:hypothetical protein
MAAILRMLAPALVWIKAFWGVLQRNQALVWLTGQIQAGAVRAVVTVSIQLVCLAAYGVFLLVFWTWVSGTTFHELFATNPFSGVPAGVMYLVSYAFPLKFLVGSFLGYIQWRLTVIPAAVVFSRVIKFTPGA